MELINRLPTSEIRKLCKNNDISKINDMRKGRLTSEMSKVSKTNRLRNICKSSEISKISKTNEVCTISKSSEISKISDIKYETSDQ